jgi:NAD-dependent dihydropyrimidine dehydrogenase PreA subunit
VRIKLDENLGMGAAEALRRAGHDVATVVDASRCNLCMRCEKECLENAIKVSDEKAKD